MISVASLVTSRRRQTLLVLVILVLLAAASTAYLATRPAPRAQLPTIAKDGSYRVGALPSDRGEAAVKAAVAALPVALSYDYRELAKGVTAATSHMTSGFAAEFANTFNKTAAPQALQQRAIANALVRGAGLVRVDGDRALCLVYVNQILVSSTTMTQTQTPIKVTESRVLVGLSWKGGHWLVASIAPF